MCYRNAFLSIWGFSCFFLIKAFGQDQKIADSLSLIYQQHRLTDTAEFELLTDLSFNEINDLKKGLQYAEKLIQVAAQKNNNKYLRVGHFLIGTKHRLLGNLDKALEAYFKAAQLAKTDKHLAAEGETYGAIADIYGVAGQRSNSAHYYHKGINKLRQSKADSISLASVLTNAGDTYLKFKNYDSALLYFDEAKRIFDRVNYASGKGYSLGNIGMVYASMGKNRQAEENMSEAIRILEQAQDYYPISVYLAAIADIYLAKGDKIVALNYTRKSLQLAQTYGLKEQIADASSKLSTLYEAIGQPNEALKYYKQNITYRDSIRNIETVQRMADFRLDYEMAQKQAEVNLLNKEKQNQKTVVLFLIVTLVLSVLWLLALYWFYQSKSKEKLRRHQQELLRAKLEIQEQTYRNISQELHDNIGQVLSLVKINMHAVDERDAEAVHRNLSEAKTLLGQVIQDIRDISKTLNTEFISETGLNNAIDYQLQLLQRTGLYTTKLVVEGDVCDHEPERELLLFRVVQELLNNTVKHGEANAIQVYMNYLKERLFIKVTDNGKGFDLAKQESNANKGLGLRNIQNRLRLIKGAISFQSQPGQGTSASIEVQL